MMIKCKKCGGTVFNLRQYQDWQVETESENVIDKGGVSDIECDGCGEGVGLGEQWEKILEIAFLG